MVAIGRKFSLVWAIVLLLPLAGCDSFLSWNDDDDGGGGDRRAAMTGSATSIEGATHIRQSVPAMDDDGEDFPGHANVWDLNEYFNIDDGGDDQFDEALELSVMVGIDKESFSSVAYEDLTFYTPLYDEDEGLVGAAVGDGSDLSLLEGMYSAHVNALAEARLMQILDLTTAVAPIDLFWEDEYDIDWDGFDSNVFYRVVVRDPADGSLLKTLYEETIDSDAPQTSRNADLSAYEGEIIVLSFERRSSTDDTDNVTIDSVSVIDDNDVEFVTNGDFETGDLSGWTGKAPAQPLGFTSPVQTILGLDVTRSFHTNPGALWGRLVDTFANNTGAAIDATIIYESDLGSDDYGIIYEVGSTNGMAIASWDGDKGDRDVGFVWGMPTTTEFLSADALGASSGEEEITHTYDITLEPGEMVTLVNFVIMTGTDTGQTAESVDARATKVDNEAKRIVNNFWSFGEFRDGMTPTQMATIANFPGGGGGKLATCEDLSGVWELHVSNIDSTCGLEPDWMSTVTIDQSGCEIVSVGIKDTVFPVTGTVDVLELTIGPEDFPDGPGITTTTFTLTLEEGSLSMTGDEVWTWTDGNEECLNGTADADMTKE